MSQWEGVREFVAVADAGSFTAASKRLKTSVAHVSRQVSALEQRLSIELLHRTTRKVSLTEAGQLYYQHCRPLLDGLEEAERALGELQHRPSGLIRLTAPLWFGDTHIMPIVNDFVLKNPQVKVESMMTNQKLDLIDSGIDLAIRLGPLENSSMRAKRLGSRTLHICVSPEYISRHGEPKSIADLQKHNCLLGTLDYWRIREQGKERTLPVQGSIKANSGYALIDAALKGIGLVQLPDYYLSEYLQSGALVEVLTAHRPDVEGIWGLYPHSRHLSTKVRMLLDYMAEQL